MAFPPNKRLTPAIVSAILMSRAHPRRVVEQLASLGIRCSVSTVRRIRDGNRWSHISRAGTMWDPDAATAHPDSPLHQAGYKRRRGKRWPRRPEYLNAKTGRLKRAYRLVGVPGIAA